MDTTKRKRITCDGAVLALDAGERAEKACAKP